MRAVKLSSNRSLQFLAGDASYCRLSCVMAINDSSNVIDFFAMNKQHAVVAYNKLQTVVDAQIIMNDDNIPMYLAAVYRWLISV